MYINKTKHLGLTPILAVVFILLGKLVRWSHNKGVVGSVRNKGSQGGQPPPPKKKLGTHPKL